MTLDIDAIREYNTGIARAKLAHRLQPIATKRQASDVCAVDDCPTWARRGSDFCETHYSRLRLHGTTDGTGRSQGRPAVDRTKPRACVACGAVKTPGEYVGRNRKCNDCRNAARRRDEG